jgi:hypothetical protein
MWMILPICCLAILHIAGDNVAVIPDMAGILGNKNIYISTLCAYIVLGLLFATILAWIGVRSGQELVVVIKDLYGVPGKKILAVIILSICIPASALTGGYYAGQILQALTGIPYELAILICLVLFSLLAAGYGHFLLILSNYIGFLLAPMVLILFFFHDLKLHFIIPSISNINWLLVLGLLGYNVGGMWSILVVEMGAYLSQRGYMAILLVILAKSAEGIFTLLVAYLVLSVDISGPLALSIVVHQVGGTTVMNIFNIVLFCTFTNTMVPAMLVNARQISSITRTSFFPALLLAGIVIYIVSCMSFSRILLIMSYSGFTMILFIIYTAYLLHKYRVNQQ